MITMLMDLPIWGKNCGTIKKHLKGITNLPKQVSSFFTTLLPHFHRIILLNQIKL